MSEVEVLVATMFQRDFSLAEKMNIRSSAVFANQCDTNAYAEMETAQGLYKLISTNLRGVGANRNTALLNATKDICILADDDVTYYDDYVERVSKEFEKHPKADIILFNFELSGGDSCRKPRPVKKPYYMHRWNRNGFPTYRIAFRRKSFLKNHLFFSTIYGGGCMYPCGEDTMWIEDARCKGMKILVSDVYIGEVDQSESTWFNDIRPEYYFYGRGAFLKNVHPKSAYLWIFLYYSHHGSSIAYPPQKRIKWMIKGLKGFENLQKFEDCP